MEPDKKEQSVFVGMKPDLNPTVIDAEKGIYTHSLNGKIIKKEGRNYAWENVSGSKKIFQVPVLKDELISQSGKANLYYFDWREFIEDWKNYAFSALQEELLFSFKITLSDYDYTSPEEQIFTAKVVVDTGAGTLTLTWYEELLTTPWSYIISLANIGDTQTYKTIVHYVLARFVEDYYPNRFISVATGSFTQLACTLGKHKTHVDDIPAEPELEHDIDALYHFTYYLQFESNNKQVQIEANGTAEPDTTYWPNLKGWGLGSVSGKMHSLFASTPPYPIPGSDKALNPDSIEQPGGISTYFKSNRWYVVLGGIVRHNGTLYNNGDQFYTGTTARVDSFSHGAKVMEIAPRYSCYGLTVQKAVDSYYYFPNTPEIVHFQPINNNELIVFCTIENERALIYKVTFGDDTSITNTLINTKEFWFSKKFTFHSIDRNESDESHFIFWSDADKVIRFLDLNKIPEPGNEDFDTRLIKNSEGFGTIKIDKVNRYGGNLLVGSYRTAFCLSHDGFVWTRYSPMTNEASLGQGYSSTTNPNKPTPTDVNDPEYRGYPEGTKTTQSLSIEVTNIDRKFKYIKIACIEYVSGSGTPIVNIVFKKELVGTDYQRLLVNYGGIQDVVESGLTISDIKNPKIVLNDSGALTHGQNRLIIGNYKEPIPKLTDDSNLGTDAYFNSLELEAVRKYIGYELSYSVNNGYKSSENQLNFKSLQIREKYYFAWVLIDEYGNESDPVGEFEFDKLLTYDKMFFLGGIPNVTIQTHPRYSNIQFDQFSYGMRINLAGIEFPSWAKKAILVRRLRDNSNQTVMLSGSGVIYPSVNNKRIANAIIPDLYGSNTAEKYTWQDGDELLVINEFNLAAEYGYSVFPFPNATYTEGTIPSKVYAWINTPMICDGDIDMNFKPQRITSFASNSMFPLSTTANVKGSSWAIDLNAPYKTFSSTDTRYCHFLIIRPRFTSGLGFIKKYQSTGFELDLKYRHPYKVDVFGGDVYNTIFTAGGTYEDEIAYMIHQNIVTCVQSKHNYALVNNAEQLNGVLEPNYNRFSYNKDYSPNPDNSYIKIDEDVNNIREEFSNTVAFSDVRIANSQEESYAIFKPNNVVDITNSFGKIQSIQYFYDYLIVIQERGIVAIPVSNKEFISTNSGTKVRTGDPAQFINMNDVRPISEKFGGVNSIKTQIGVYTFDIINKVFVFITFQSGGPKAIPLSIEKDFNTLFQYGNYGTYKNSIECTGYSLGYDNQLSKVYLTLFSKVIEDCTIESTSGNYEAVVSTSTNFKVGQYVQFDSDNMYFVFKIQEIVDIDDKKRLIIEAIPDLAGLPIIDNETAFPNSGTLSSVDYEYLTFCFNESTMELESVLTIPSTKFSFINESVVYLDGHTNKVIHYHDKQRTGEQTKFDFVSTALLHGFKSSIITDASSLSKSELFYCSNIEDARVYPLNIQNSPAGQELTIDLFRVAFHSTAADTSRPLISVQVASKNKYRYFKGHTYRIKYEMTWASGSQVVWAHLGLLPFMYEDFVEINSGNYYDSDKSFYPTNTGQVKTMEIEFTALKTFECPLFFIVKDVNTQVVGSRFGYIDFEIKEYSCSEVYHSEIEVSVFDPQSKDNIFDNAFINQNNTEFIDDVMVVTPVVSHTDQGMLKQKFWKNRLKIELPRKPKDVGYERMNGIWAKIRFTIKNNLPNFVIDNITTLYRKLPK